MRGRGTGSSLSRYVSPRRGRTVHGFCPPVDGPCTGSSSAAERRRERGERPSWIGGSWVRGGSCGVRKTPILRLPGDASRQARRLTPSKTRGDITDRPEGCQPERMACATVKGVEVGRL